MWSDDILFMAWPWLWSSITVRYNYGELILALLKPQLGFSLYYLLSLEAPLTGKQLLFYLGLPIFIILLIISDILKNSAKYRHLFPFLLYLHRMALDVFASDISKEENGKARQKKITEMPDLRG